MMGPVLTQLPVGRVPLTAQHWAHCRVAVHEFPLPDGHSLSLAVPVPQAASSRSLHGHQTPSIAHGPGERKGRGSRRRGMLQARPPSGCEDCGPQPFLPLPALLFPVLHNRLAWLPCPVNTSHSGPSHQLLSFHFPPVASPWLPCFHMASGREVSKA